MSSISRLRRKRSDYSGNKTAKHRLEQRLRADMAARGERILNRILFRLNCQWDAVLATFHEDKVAKLISNDPILMAINIVESRIFFYPEYMKEEFDRLFKRSQIRIRKSEEDN